MLAMRIVGGKVSAALAERLLMGDDLRIAAGSPLFESSAWRTGSINSPTICSGVSISRSRVRVTEPSVEFSTGTTPTSAWRAPIAVKTAAIDSAAINSALEPKRFTAARWV